MSEASARRGPPPVPGIGSSIAAIFRLQMRRLVRGKKLRLAVFAALLVLVSVVAARYAADLADPVKAVRSGIQWGFFRLLAFLLPFLLCSGAIAEEVEGRTFTYLASRPAGRFAVTFGKYLAGALVAVGLLVVLSLLLHVAAFASEPTEMIEELGPTARAAVALGLLGLLYSAICTFWGAAVPEASGIVSALHLVVLEFLFAFIKNPSETRTPLS